MRFGDWANHIESVHPDLIPEDWTPARYLYYLQTGMKVGRCVECKGPTDWNEGTQKYERYCKNPACKQKYIKRAKSRMVSTYGKEYILTDPDVQRKMQAAKHISGTVKFDDGGEVEYVGSYEKEFLEMLNTFNFSSNDIIAPSPNTYYYYYENDKDKENEGEKFYIPDFFIPSLNLEIEIKSQLNTHHKIQDIDKVKERLKDEVMKSIPTISYIKLNDKNYTEFFDFLITVREKSEKERPKVSPSYESIVNDPKAELLDLGMEQAIRDYSDTVSEDGTPIVDFSKYTRSNINELTRAIVDRDIAVQYAAATEGFIQEKIGFWKAKLFPGYFTGNVKMHTTRYITLNKVIVDSKRGIISLQNINIRLLLQRIEETYGDKKVEFIFECMYSKKSIDRYKRKKISRSNMQITALETPVFFALELNVLFMELYDQYHERTYKAIADTIYDKTWVKDCDNATAPKLNTGILKDVFDSKFVLKPHQQEFIEVYPSLKAKLNMRGYLLAFDQGLGKTITSIALSVCLKATRVYIVCPNSMKEVWKDEIRKYIAAYVASPVLADREILICGKINPTAENIRSAKYIIVNNESIKTMHPYIVSTEKPMMIVDEVHNFRNNKGSRVQELIELREKINPSDVLLMSGTPIKAAPAEIVPSLRLLDPLFTPEAANIYAKCFNLDTTMAMNVVKKRFGYIMYRKTKAILDMPPKTVMDLRFPIKDYHDYIMSVVRKDVLDLFTQYYTEELGKNMNFQARFLELVKAYSKSSIAERNTYIEWVLTLNTKNERELHELDQAFMESYLQNYVFPHISSDAIIKELKELERKFIHMRKSCMGRAIGKIYPPRRTQLFISLYEENKQKIINMIQYNTKKTVIFSQLLGVIHYISQSLTDAGIGNVKIVGGTSNRIDIINQFKDDDNIMVILATSQTLGTGVTLIEANQMFFFGPPWRSTDFDQCCDRIYRIGQTSSVTIYNVILETKEFNLSDRMNKILTWSGEMFGAAVDDLKLDDESPASESYIPAEEAFLFNKKNSEYNLDKLSTEGGKNLLFITGLSGGGKSTLAFEYADKYDPSIYIELDAIECNHNLFHWGDDDMPTGHKIIKDFFQKRYGGEKVWNLSNREEHKDFIHVFDDFMLYLREFAANHSGVIFIVEGVQLAFSHSVYLNDDDPLIITGTSTVVSSYRAAKRSHEKFIPKLKFNNGELSACLKVLKKRFDDLQ